MMNARHLSILAVVLLTIPLVAAQQMPAFELALVDRAGTITRLGRVPGIFAPRISPDGRRDDYDVWAFSPSDRVMKPLVGALTSSEMGSRFSPDGKWLAYQANDSGTFEVYLESYPRAGTRTRVTSAGGQCPVWSPDGREIIYDRDRALFSVSIQTTPKIEVGKEIALPVKGFLQQLGRRRQWDMTPDGKQFLVVLP
jgi:WD40-like Beta Propeller Repeat